MDNGSKRVLINEAIKARERAQAPFSGFKVGAALLARGGKIYTGCNIENTSLGLSFCAERVALVKAISEGETDFVRLAIVADTYPLTYPCGACRQVIWEFSQGMEIVLANLDGLIKNMTIEALLPNAFNFRLVQGDHERSQSIEQSVEKLGIDRVGL